MEQMVMKGSKRKIAVPLFGDRVSPHFGSSSRFLVVMTEKENILDQMVLDLNENGPLQQARQLVSLGVGGVLCGGIQMRYKEWLIRKGVDVVDNQRGNVQNVLKEFLGRNE